MTLSVPGVLVSRDGLVREYVGHSNQSGTLFGHVKKLGRNHWRSVCVGCGAFCGSNMRKTSVEWLHNHWRNADASMAARHVWRNS